MTEYKGRVETYSREVLRKESQIKELQGRIETGDGCEYCPSCPSPLSPSLWPSSAYLHLPSSLPCLPAVTSILT